MGHGTATATSSTVAVGALRVWFTLAGVAVGTFAGLLSVTVDRHAITAPGDPVHDTVAADLVNRVQTLLALPRSALAAERPHEPRRT